MDVAMCLAIPGRILETSDEGASRIAKVQFGGVTRQIHLDFVPEANIGDYVLVHVGFAISRIDEEEAARTFQLLREMGEVE
jgi:hydrogenase expression/formation protein HypC